METAVELIQKLKDKAFQTEKDKKLIESFEIERLKQLTPVEWLEEQINPYGVSVHQDLFEKVKEMEKEQREKDFIAGYKKRAELSNLIFDEVSELSAKQLFKQQEQ